MAEYQYTVYRCASLTSDQRVGPVHASACGNFTACGQHIDERWWIASNTPGANGVTCKKCRVAATT